MKDMTILLRNFSKHTIQGLIPFGNEGNDTGPLVFDARGRSNLNEYPIRVFDQYAEDLHNLGDVIFSSFPKLLECVTHFLNMTRGGLKKDFEIIQDFFLIDSEGAGTPGGKAYWNTWSQMMRANQQ